MEIQKKKKKKVRKKSTRKNTKKVVINKSSEIENNPKKNERNKKAIARKKFFVYLRVSSSNYSTSIETQLDIIKKRILWYEVDWQIIQDWGWVVRDLWRVIEDGDLLIIKEQKSWYKKIWEENIETRPEFSRMMEQLEEDSKEKKMFRKYWWIIFFKIDRLFRNDVDWTRILTLLKKDYQLISSTETIENTPVWRMLFKMLWAMAVLESDKLSNRISYSIIYNFIERNFHKLWWTLWFWYRVKKYKDWKNSKIIIEEKEKKIINKIYSLYNKWSLVKDITNVINNEFNWYLTHYLVEKKKKDNKKDLEKLEKIEEQEDIIDEDLFSDELDLDSQKEIIRLNKYIDDEIDEDLSKKWYTKEENLVYNILMNYKKHNIRYNWYIVKEIKIPDELIKNYILSIKDKINNYDWLEIKDEIITTGNSIIFISYEPSFILMEDEYEYEYVEKNLKIRELERKVWENTQEMLQKESLFYDILFYITDKNYQKTTIYSQKKYINYSGNFFSKSQVKIENAIKQSWIIEKIIENKNLNLIKGQVIAMAKRYQIKSIKEVAWRILYLERVIEDRKFNIENTEDEDNIKMQNKILKMEIIELKKLNDRKAKIEIDSLDLANSFLDLFKKWFFEKDTRVRKEGYRVFFEKIVMNRDMTLTIVLNDFVAEICWMERTIENIAILDKQPQE